MKIRFKPVGAQREFFHDDESKLLHLSAGFGFGKTTILCYKLLKLSMLNKGFSGGLVCPSYTDFKRDVLPAMEGVCDKHRIKYRFHGSDHYFQFPWSNGRLYVATAEKKLRGPNWAYAGINEVTLIPLIRYQEVIGRVRVRNAPCPQIVSSGTPEGISSEYYTIFVENPWKGAKILYGDTRENAENLEQGYIERVMSTYPTQLIDAYIKGLWVNLSGNRFYFSYDPLKNDTHYEPDSDLHYHCAMDFNVDPFCASIWQNRGQQWVAVDEVMLEHGAGYNTQNMIDALKVRGYNQSNTYIYPDPAGQARTTKGMPDVEILRRAGYEVRVKSSAPRMRERQINMNNLFEKGIIKINGNRCKSLKRDFLAVEQDPVTLEKAKKNPKLTHFSDGADYMFDVLLPFQGHRTKNIIQTIR